jgi:hypothetical protein
LLGQGRIYRRSEKWGKKDQTGSILHEKTTFSLFTNRYPSILDIFTPCKELALFFLKKNAIACIFPQRIFVSKEEIAFGEGTCQW